MASKRKTNTRSCNKDLTTTKKIPKEIINHFKINLLGERVCDYVDGIFYEGILYEGKLHIISKT